MANKTTNYNLTKPLPEEFYDIGVHNGNMDIIDTELKKRATLENGKVPTGQLPNASEINGVAKNEDIIIQKNGATYETIFGQGTRNALLRVRNVAGDSSNQRTLALFDSTQRPDLETALRLYDVVNGAETIYSIFGEHNPEKMFASGATRIATGSYTGVGSSGGSGNKKTITVGFKPKFVMITNNSNGIQLSKYTYSATGFLFWHEGITSSISANDGKQNTNFTGVITQTDTGISFVHSSNNFNYTGNTYVWVAIG